MEKYIIEIEGDNISGIKSLIEEFNIRMFDKFRWNGSLDALNDLLRGGFGNIADCNFILVWKNHQYSKLHLGHDAMLEWLEITKESAHPSNQSEVEKRIEAAKNKAGETYFDLIIEIIKDHGDQGSEAEDGIEVMLE